MILLDSQSLYQRFTPEDMELLVGVGSQIASAIDNARSHEDILKKEKLDRELMLGVISSRASCHARCRRAMAISSRRIIRRRGRSVVDYYDLIALPNSSMAVLLGDVSGKGVPAALFMAKVTSDARVSLISRPEDPAAAMQNINNLVCAAALADKFMTLILCLLDPNKASDDDCQRGICHPWSDVPTARWKNQRRPIRRFADWRDGRDRLRVDHSRSCGRRYGGALLRWYQ